MQGLSLFGLPLRTVIEVPWVNRPPAGLAKPIERSSTSGQPIKLFQPFDPMFAIGLDLPCERIPTVEPEMRDRDEMHLLGVVEAEIQSAHDTAFVAHVSDFRDAALVRKILARILL